MSALGDEAIKRGIDEGVIVIDPFREEQLNNASYDVRIGRYCWIPVPNERLSIDPSLEPSVKHFSLHDMKEKGPVTIHQGGFALFHTEEFIGGRMRGDVFGVLGTMKTTSTAARWGIDICRAAGWGDVGFFNRWTLEIENSAPWSTIIKPGMRLGQVVFKEIDGVNGESSYEKRGNYQSSDDVEQLKKSWNPEMMLPKAIKMVEPD
jgi:dCTP deaminase